MNEFIRPLFPLGEVKIMVTAADLIAQAGQDADFFLQMHACGIWSDQDADRNQESLKDGTMILNRYHTLLGEEITVVTFSDRGQTGILCNRFENSTSLYDPVGVYDGYTCAEASDGGGPLPNSDSTPPAPAEEASLSNLGILGTIDLYQTTEPSKASPYDYAYNSLSCNFPHETNSVSSPDDEAKPVEYNYTLSGEGLTAQSYLSFIDPFKHLGYVPNMTYDTGDWTPIDPPSTLGSADTPPDKE